MAESPLSIIVLISEALRATLKMETSSMTASPNRPSQQVSLPIKSGPSSASIGSGIDSPLCSLPHRQYRYSTHLLHCQKWWYKDANR